MRLILRYAGLLLGLFIADQIFTAVTIDGFETMLIAALVLLGINVLVRPILHVLTLPINIITLGLFGSVLNLALFWFGQVLVPGFSITGFWNILGAAVITLFIYNLAGNND